MCKYELDEEQATIIKRALAHWLDTLSDEALKLVKRNQFAQAIEYVHEGANATAVLKTLCEQGPIHE